MAKILATAPILLVRNVLDAANYYRDALGFTYDKLWGDPPDFCMVQRDEITVMLSEAPHNSVPPPNWQVVANMWDAYFWVDDVESLYKEFREQGATIDYELGMKDYGVLEFGVQDLDGHDLAFGQVMG